MTDSSTSARPPAAGYRLVIFDWDGTLLDSVSNLLAPRGVLLFATNKRRFKLDASLAERFAINDVTAATTPPDFTRRPPHKCWEIRNL